MEEHRGRRPGEGGLIMSKGKRRKYRPPNLDPRALMTMAWMLRGISTIPGLLILRGGRVSFESADSGSAWGFQLRRIARRQGRPDFSAILLDGEQVEIFNEPLSEVEIIFPWYYFMGGVKVKTRLDCYRFSFGPPTNRLEGMVGLSYISIMRAAGREWKAALETAHDAVQDPDG